MKERIVEFSYLAQGHVIQSVVLTDDSVSAGDLMELLNTGKATTSVLEGQDVIVWADIAKPVVLGYVNSTTPELEYEEFDLIQESEIETALQPFNATRLALHHAVGEYIDEPEMTIDEVIKVLGQYAYSPPVMAVHENVEGWTGKDILSAIEADKRDLMNLMTIAHNAAKLGKELI